MNPNKDLIATMMNGLHDEELYDMIARDIKIEYNDCIANLSNPDISIIDLRLCIHKLVSVLIYFGKNSEMMYICRLLLAIDKDDTDRQKYTPYIDQLKIYNINDYL